MDNCMERSLCFCELVLLLLMFPCFLNATAARAVCDDSKRQCGNISIPYPFGLSLNCSRSPDYLLSCNQTSDPPKLSFNYSTIIINGTTYNHDVEILNIALEQGSVRAKAPVAVVGENAYNFQFDRPATPYWTYSLRRDGPYTISQSQNMLTAVGCGTAVFATDHGGDLALCAATCSNAKVTSGSCTGIGCCQTSIPSGLRSYGLQVQLLNSSRFTTNTKVLLVEKDKFTFNSSFLAYDGSSYVIERTNFPFVLDWVVDNITCDDAKKLTTYACVSNNSACIDVLTTQGYICNCSTGFRGNPYIFSGCQDVDECQTKDVCPRGHYCINIPGSFRCEFSDLKGGSSNRAVLAGVGASFGLLVLVAMLALFYRKWKARNLEKFKQRNYKQNHGMLLEKLISLDEGGSVSDQGFMVYPLTEIEKATNNFDSTRVLGNGGHATVYKGLLSDKRVVAIKKSKLTNPQEIKEFINEVFILSRIRHRNVVKLLGCCLETEVPLLVYEFIPNGTLAEHLHISRRPSSSLSWDDRLRIAAETASALAHLHCDASISVFHRDVKSSNILLDSNFTAKVSDFGASRSIPLHQSVTAGLDTVVQGTFGYLDPEHFHTGQLTQKSDVYSFGVILAELLTGEKPISLLRTEGQANLGIYFVSSIHENRIFEIVEPNILTDITRKDIEAVAKLAESCLKMQGDERPTMKEVEMALVSLRRSMKTHQCHHPWSYNADNDEESSNPLFHRDNPNQSRFTYHEDSTGKYSSEMQFMSSSTMEYPR